MERDNGTVRRDEGEIRFRRLFEFSNDGIFLLDVEADAILDANSQACRMLGFTRDELLALPMSAIHPHELDALRSFARRVHEHGHAYTDELTCRTKAGTYLEAEITAAVVELADRRCVIASVRDVSERIQIARELRALRTELATPTHPEHELTLTDVKQLERRVMLRALERCEWRIYGPGGAAARLDLKPSTLASRLKAMGIRRPTA